MPPVSRDRPQLLVSVRNADEARAAIAGGCDILDIKEPANGSLGMADLRAIREVREAADGIPVSAALGETREWLLREAPPVVLPKLAYCKLGTAGLANSRDWVSDWRAVRRRFDAEDSQALNWIAVAYADRQAAEAPSPNDILRASAADSNCAGLLIDTFAKTGRSTFDWFEFNDLQQLLLAAKSTGLLVAVAGLCCLDDVRRAVALSPDIIAVRTLACADGLRNSRICSTAVGRLRKLVAAVPNATLHRDR